MATLVGTSSLSRLYRIGGLSGVLAAILGLVANVLHPRLQPSALGDQQALTDLVNGYALWRFDHLLIIVAVFLGLIALVALARSMDEGEAGHWARVGSAVAVASVAVALVSFAIDGLVLSALSEQSATSADGRAFSEVYSAVQSVDLAVFSVTILMLFGATPLVFALAVMASETYARWIGVTALIGALAGFVSGGWIWLTGELGVGSFLIAFTLATVAFTVWTFAASLRLLALGRS